MSDNIKIDELKNDGNSNNSRKTDKKKTSFWDYDFLEFLMRLVVLSFAITLLIWFVIDGMELFRNIYNSKNVNYNKYPIASVCYDEDIEGENFRFVLGKGSVSEKGYYVVYQILDDGGKKLLKLDVEKTIIYDILEVGDTPYVELGERDIYGDYLNIRLYVPKGTIQQEYDLSLE